MIARLLWAALISALLPGQAAAAAAQVSWHHSLSLANDGYWPQRIAVTVTNETGEALAGTPVVIAADTAAGAAVAALRACRSDGVELLFDLRDNSGASKRAGTIAATDKLFLPVECAARSTATLYVYFGNTQAWPVLDFLPAAQPNSKLRVAVGPIEWFQLRPAAAPAPRTGPGWDSWAEVRARNFEAQPVEAALIRVNLRAALARLPGVPQATAFRVASPEGTELPAYALRQGAELLFAAGLPATSEQAFQIALGPRAETGALDGARTYEQLLVSRANLVPNADFERGPEQPESWPKLATGGPHQIKAGFSREGRFGKRSLELTVGENARAEWVGWKSEEIPVKPGAEYLLSGWLKAVGLQSSASLHVHFHDTHGALTKSGSMASTQPAVSGDSDWVNSIAYLQAPPDAATVQLHLTMNTAGTLRHDGLVLCRIVEGQLAGVHRGSNGDSDSELRVWSVNPLIKVFPDSPPQGQVRQLSAELARNEYEPVQLALRGLFGAPKHLAVSISPLTNHSGAALPPVPIDRVAFVPIDYPSAYYSTTIPEWCRKTPRGAGATDGWAGWWPDPLAPGSEFELPANQTQPIWLTVHAPKLADAGEYKAEIRLSVDGLPSVKLPLTVTVLPFALPDRSHLRAIFDLRFGPGGTFGSGPNSIADQRRWLRFMAEHRLGIDGIHPPPKFSYKDGQVTMDAAEFDEMARFCFDELGMNVCYTPQFFYLFGWAYPPKKLFGLEPFSPEWVKALKAAYDLFSTHLREKGWHDKFVYYISDEPHFQQSFVVDQMKRLCRLIHEVDSTIPIYSSTWRHCAAWDDSLDLWGVGQYGCFPVPEMERLQKAGKHFWFTCDGQMATDTPFLATERMLPYYCFKYGVEGFEFWGFAWWTYDPWKAGWHQFIRQSDEGKNYYWVRYPDGDGFLVYPGKAVGVDGPVSTIRLEQVREGLEDYEAMHLLAGLAQQARQAGQPHAAAERALAMARDLVLIPNAGGLRSSEILPDPDRIPAIRRAVNAALVELSK